MTTTIKTSPGEYGLNAELDDKRDAERFRWLLDNCTDFIRPVNGELTDGRFRYKRGSCFSPREAIDKAMAATREEIKSFENTQKHG